MSFVDLAAQSYAAFALGDLDAVLENMHDDIEWHQAQGLAHGGVYYGLDEVRRNVFHPRAPRSLDASKYDDGTRSSDA